MTGGYDIILVVGEDILASLPGPAAKALAKMQIVYLGPPGGLTDKKATVSLHTEDTITSGYGTMTRVDMKEVEFKKWKATKEAGTISEALQKLHELISKKKT
jgi:formylmethanofuran dehydrogenase subunit B